MAAIESLKEYTVVDIVFFNPLEQYMKHQYTCILPVPFKTKCQNANFKANAIR